MRGFHHYSDAEVVAVIRRPARPRARARGADVFCKFLSLKSALFLEIPSNPGLHLTTGVLFIHPTLLF